MKDDIPTLFEPNEIVEKTVNNNGQIYLGRDLSGEDIRVAYEIVESDNYECDKCGKTYSLAEVAIFGRNSDDEEVVCVDCLTPEDRIID